MGTGNRFNEQEDVNPSEEDDARWEDEKDRRAEAEAKREECICGDIRPAEHWTTCPKRTDHQAESEYRRQVRDWRNDSGV
jgi:hypothetical protein